MGGGEEVGRGKGGLEGQGRGFSGRCEGYSSVVHLHEAVGAAQRQAHLPQTCRTQHSAG